MLAKTFKFFISPYTKGQTHLSHKDALVASLGSFIAISVIFLFTIKITSNHNTAALIAASTGATAFLIFTLPTSVFSNNWSVIGGHLVSAFIGVSCFKLLGSSVVATALSVALAVIGMHLLRCPHPPGGATALLAVIGGENVTQLGYHYILFPILVNVLTLLVISHSLNMIVSTISKAEKINVLHAPSITFMPLSNELTNQKEALKTGGFYSHSQHNLNASIRRVISIYNDDVSYEVIQGAKKGKTECTTYKHFMAWARFKVVEIENHAA